MTDTKNVTQRYSAVVGELTGGDRLCELGPGRPNREAHASLATLSAESVAGGRSVRDPEMASACQAGLWLWHDYLDESHRISQSIETPTGSYWHGIMHRREPDASNAKYWFRRVGDHPVYEELAAIVGRLVAENEPLEEFLSVRGGWDPFRFVDACEEARGRGDAAEQFCREIQRAEWWALFDFSYRAAFSTE